MKKKGWQQVAQNKRSIIREMKIITKGGDKNKLKKKEEQNKSPEEQ